MVNIATVIEFLEEFAPSHLAAQWDNVGLLLGDRQTAVQRIMTCLTVTPQSAAEALSAGAQLIVSHHPILFRGIKRLTTATPEGRMLLELIRGGVAVYSPHTAFDNTAGGINESLARRLDLQEIGPLRQGAGPRRCKVVVFVPDTDLERVSQAMFAAGAGRQDAPTLPAGAVRRRSGALDRDDCHSLRRRWGIPGGCNSRERRSAPDRGAAFPRLPYRPGRGAGSSPAGPLRHRARGRRG